MKRNLFLFLLLISMCIPGFAIADDYNIKGDTIRVSSSTFPLLSFMGEIRDYQPLCSDYRLIASTTTITIRPNVSKPVPVCLLIVSEGSKGAPRQHQFVLIFDKEADPADQIHDYSTKDLIEKRVDYLERVRKMSEGGKGSAKAGGDEPKAKESSRAKKKESRKAKAAEESKPAAMPEQKTVSLNTRDEEKEPVPATGSGNSREASEIKDIPTELIEARVKQKINLFYKSCSLLCSKTDIDETIKYGMKLFNNDEEVLVETTNAKTKSASSKKIRQYFTHLAQLNYRKVVMTASDIKFVSKFHLGPDKKWHASAVVIQDFKGYKDNILAYKDITNKTIDIIVNTFEEERDGKTIMKFEIYLGNISVTNIPS